MHPFMIGKIQVGRNILLWRALGLAGIAVAGALAMLYQQHLTSTPRDKA
jgi:hypothetical protein